MARSRYGSGSLWEEPRANGRRVWVAQFHVCGRQVQRVLGNVRARGRDDGMTRAMAERAMRDARAAAEQEVASAGTPAARETATIEEVAERHFAYLLTAMGRRERTVEDYRGILRVHLVPHFADTPVAEITKQDVERLIVAVIESGRSHGTMLNVLNLLHAILEEALREDLIDSNPVAKARRPRAPRANHQIRFLTPEEVDAVIRAVPDDDLGRVERALYLTAAWTGMRQGELVALRWRNVDFQAAKIRVRESFSDGRLTDPKSFRSIRAVPMLPVVAQALAVASQRDHFADDDDLVFAHPYAGSHLGQSTIYPRFVAACKAAGVRRVRFHDLRHTFGTQMVSGGVTLRALQTWMGHASSSTTEVYADYAPVKHEHDLALRAFEMVTARPDATREPLLNH